MSKTTQTPRFSDWVVRQRPAGHWVVDQLDREKMKVRRYGPYRYEMTARCVYQQLVNPIPPFQEIDAEDA